MRRTHTAITHVVFVADWSEQFLENHWQVTRHAAAICVHMALRRPCNTQVIIEDLIRSRALETREKHEPKREAECACAINHAWELK